MGAEKEPLALVVVAKEKEVQKLAGVLRTLSRKVPLRMQVATQAIEGPAAFSRMMEQMGKLDACFFHSRFTAPGKEPYSEVLGKTLKRKFPDTPIIGFGKKGKAGTKGKHYHAFLETDEDVDAQELLQLLFRVQDKNIETKKNAKPTYRRSSQDEASAPQADAQTRSELYERNAFPKNAQFRKATWSGGSFSQPGSPGSPYFNNGAGVFQSTHGSGSYRSGPSTPTGVRTPTSYNPCAMLMHQGSPNAELIHQLSVELERLKTLIYEKKAKELSHNESSRSLEAEARHV